MLVCERKLCRNIFRFWQAKIRPPKHKICFAMDQSFQEQFSTWLQLASYTKTELQCESTLVSHIRRDKRIYMEFMGMKCSSVPSDTTNPLAIFSDLMCFSIRFPRNHLQRSGFLDSPKYALRERKRATIILSVTILSLKLTFSYTNWFLPWEVSSVSSLMQIAKIWTSPQSWVVPCSGTKWSLENN